MITGQNSYGPDADSFNESQPHKPGSKSENVSNTTDVTCPGVRAKASQFPQGVVTSIKK